MDWLDGFLTLEDVLLFICPSFGGNLRFDKDLAPLFRHKPDALAFMEGFILKVERFALLEPMFIGKLDIEAKPSEGFKAVGEVKANLGILKAEAACFFALDFGSFPIFNLTGKLILFGKPILDFSVALTNEGFNFEFKLDLWVLKIEMVINLSMTPRWKGKIEIGFEDLQKEIENLVANMLMKLQEHCVYGKIIVQFFGEIFVSLDKAVFNFLLEKASMFCVAERGMRLKILLPQLEQWCSRNLKPYGVNEVVAHKLAGFPFSIQAATLMVLPDKRVLKEKGILQNICPSLTNSQLFHLLSYFQPSQKSNVVPSSVLQTLKSLGDISRDLTDLYIK